MTGLHWIAPDQPVDAFPPPDRALRDPDGLLAIGGDLSRDRLLGAYRKGIFPWFNPGQPVLWWSPDPRAVLFPAELHVSRRLRRKLRQQPFEFSIDGDFAGVMRACATIPRYGQRGTWITDDMFSAYCDLHEAGYAHSIEVWSDQRLVGGIYGVALGKVFFGESMFSAMADAAKAAMLLLVREMQARGFVVLDCQIASAHLASLGSREIERREFLRLLDENAHDDTVGRWHFKTNIRNLHGFDPTRGAT